MMDMQDVPIFGNTIDKSEIPPIHQKRILAFVNHFLISTCSFLNDFALKCESKFINVERKLQKVEASLVIIESKLASVPDLQTKKEQEDNRDVNEVAQGHLAQDSGNNAPNQEVEDNKSIDEPTLTGVKACQDARYKKYFKMVQFGVPMNAVKVKMGAEGFDPNILDNPDAILPDGVPCEEPDT